MKTVFLILLVTILGCTQPKDKQDVSGAEKSSIVGKNLITKNFKDIYFAGQPSKEDLKSLKAQGFAHIINIRKSEEHDEAGEKKIASDNGLIYTHIPFPDGDIDDAYVTSVTKKVVEHRKQGKTLIHCGSGIRVSIWVGAHFFKDHDYSKEKAIGIAKEMGMTHPKAQEKLQKYLDKK